MHLIPEKRTGLEFLDLPPEVCTMEELEGSLADIRAVNRYLGDRRALLKHLVPGMKGRESIAILDVATGSADLPIAIVEWARKNGVAVAITAVDINPRTVEVARRVARSYPEIRLMVADALELPFADRSFDFVLCSKTLHHMKDPEAICLIREVMRVAGRGYIVMDLRRSWLAYWLIYILTRLFTKNRLTRYDGPYSVLKSFTTGELSRLASSAGASSFRVHREPFWLLVLAGERA